MIRNQISMLMVLAMAQVILGTAAAQNDDGQEETDIIDLIEVIGQPGWRATTASSATGLNVPLDEIPISIQVITADVIADFQLLSNRDAQQFHASMDDKRIRGFNSGEFFRNGFIHLSDVPGYEIERLEILSGPTAVLNGPTTPAGAVNVVSKSPMLDETFGQIGTYWGISGDDRDNVGVNVDLNMGEIQVGASSESRAAFRFVGGYQTDTGFGTRVDNKMGSLLPMFEWRLNDETVINLEYYQYQISTDRTDRPMGIELTIPGSAPDEQIPIAVAYGIDPRTSWFPDDTEIEESLDDYSVSIAHKFSDRVLGTLKYVNHNRDFEFGPGNRPRIDIFYVMALDPGAPAGSTNPDDYQLRRLSEEIFSRTDIDQATATFAFLPDGTANHQIVGGVHFYDQFTNLGIMRPRLSGTTSGFYFEFFDPATVATDDLSFNRNGDDVFWTTVLRRHEKIQQNNVFVNYHGTLLSDRLNVLLGLTYSDISIERGDPGVQPMVFDKVADNAELLPQAGFVFDLTDTFGVFANYSKSQLPDLNDPDFATSPPVRIGEQVEVGVRFDLLDGMFNGDISYFWIEEDLSGETFRKAKVDGFEVDATLSPTDNTSVIVSYASQNSEISASSDPTSIGDPLPDEIPHKIAVWSRYEFSGQRVEGLSLGAGIVWTGERVRGVACCGAPVFKLNGNVLHWEPETRVDLFAQYERNGFEYSLNLRNVTKEVNVTNGSPRVLLQGGLRADGITPYVFDGDMEIMLGIVYRY